MGTDGNRMNKPPDRKEAHSPANFKRFASYEVLGRVRYRTFNFGSLLYSYRFSAFSVRWSIRARNRRNVRAPCRPH